MIKFDRITPVLEKGLYFRKFHWEYHRFVFIVTEDHASIACPINGEEEVWKDAILL
jgi:hypothetical protein